MNWWNDLETIKIARIAIGVITALLGLFTAILWVKEYCLGRQKSARDRTESNIQSEIGKAEVAFVSMKALDREGMYTLKRFAKNSEYKEVREKASSLLEEAQKALNGGRIPSSRIDFGFLKEINPEQADSTIQFILNEKRSLKDINNDLMNFNLHFGTDFKIYELEKLKKWGEDKKYMPLLEEAKKH